MTELNAPRDPAQDTEPTDRLPYVTPTLVDFGQIAELTEGTFAGVGVDFGIYS